MTAYQAGPCVPWITLDDLQDDRFVQKEILDLPDALKQEMIDAAVDWLFTVSQAQFPGTCTDTIRPASQPMDSLFQMVYPWTGSPYMSGMWWPWQWNCDDKVSSVDLGFWPLTAVTEVMADGVVLDPLVDYRVDNWRWLVRLPDPTNNIRRYWQCCQRLDLPTTEIGTWSVTIEYGMPPPPMAIPAAKQLTVELLKPCLSRPTSLPLNATSVNRNGISYQLVDIKSLPTGKLGLLYVDMFLDAYAPDRGKRAPQIWSPDLARTGRITGT